MSEKRIILNGRTPLKEAGEALGIEFTEEEHDAYDTVNGFLVSRLDRIPAEDEHSELEYGGYVFKIVSVENKTIKQVKAAAVMREQDGQEKEDSGEQDAE